MYKKTLQVGQSVMLPRTLLWKTLVVAYLCSACTAPDVVIGTRDTMTPAKPSGAHDGSGAAGSSAADAATISDVPGNTGMSNGCGKLTAGADGRVTVSAGTGNYFLDFPQTYDAARPYPLLFAFHQENDTASNFHQSLDLVAVTGEDAIVVYPDCLNGASVWSPQRDLPYFDTLLSHLLETYCIDLHRVFVLGYADGGLFASTVACQRGQQLRGGALFAGTPAFAPCQTAVAMLILQGTMDQVFPASAGRNTRDFWAYQNQCDTSSSSPVSPSPCVEYAGCAANAPVRYCEYDGGHELPPFGTSAVWQFFSALH